MEIKTKQRMIGIVIIAIIMLILVPLLFSKSKESGEESMVEQTPTTETQSGVNLDQEAVITEQPEINADQPQPAITEQPEQPETSTMVEPVVPQDNQQLSTPIATDNGQPKAAENITTPNTPIAVPANDSKSSASKAPVPVNVTVEKSINLVDAKPAKVVKPITTTKNWSIQLGVFSKKTNASHLVNKLKKGNFDVHMKEVQGANGKAYRVFVGNKYDRNKAQKVAYNLEKIYHIKGVLVSN